MGTFEVTQEQWYEIMGYNHSKYKGRYLPVTGCYPDSINDFCKKLDLDTQVFDEVKGESESLGGLLLELNSKMPKNGAKIRFKDFEFTILAVDTRKIKKVKVYLNGGEKDSTSPFTD